MATLKPLIVIVGQTASGKSALAMDLAVMFNGEIIAADSRTIYRGMDILTAKPTKRDQELVRHHLIDVISPEEIFTVSKFKDLTLEAIDDIHARAKIPILVGGSGLYVDSVIYDYGFLPSPSAELRQQLRKLSVEDLQDKIQKLGLSLPPNSRNPVHLIRIIETNGKIPTKKPLRKNTLIIGIEIEKENLANRVSARVDAMLNAGLIDEVRSLSQQYDEDLPAFQIPGYLPFHQYMQGNITLEEAKSQFIKNDLSLAKHQKTWFKRNKDIQWVQEQIQAVDLVTTFLNK
jgi:tRNA dimethylallyltransferase